MDSDEIRRSIEAILFASGEPVSSDRMALAIGVSEAIIHQEAKTLQDDYSFSRRGMRIVRLENSYQMVSAKEQAEIISNALEMRKPSKLSSASLEVLTVIAYYQPTTKAFVEQIRGVDSTYTISSLLNKKLIEEQGRLTVPGRPILYGTTPDFLRTFGLTSLEELPNVDLPQVSKTPDQFESQIHREEDTHSDSSCNLGNVL